MDVFCFFFFFKQKTAYEMRISDWSSDVCSSDLRRREFLRPSADHGAAIAGAGAARLRRTADRAAQGGRLYQPLCRRAEHAAVSVRDLKSVVVGNHVSVRVDRLGGRNLKKHKYRHKARKQHQMISKLYTNAM